MRQLLPRLADAMRTASLPDGAGRILLVRRLQLGLIDRDITSARLSRRIEEGLLGSDRRFCHAAEADAGDASVVWFRDSLDAHTHLALRLVDGPPPTEWFWRLAVPGWDCRQQGPAALRLLAYSLAALPEAAVALPHWFAAFVGAGKLAALRAALHDSDVRELAQAAGLPAAPEAAASLQAATTVARSDPLDSVNVSDAVVADAPVERLIRRMLHAAGYPARAHESVPMPAERHRRPVSRQRSSGTSIPPYSATVVPPQKEPVEQVEASAERSELTPPTTSAPTVGTDALTDSATRTSTPLTNDRPTTEPGSAPGARGPSDVRQDEPARPETVAVCASAPQDSDHCALDESPAWIDAEATAAGGLLLLLNVLNRLGYPAWSQTEPAWREYQLLERVLLQVLINLDVAETDPIWSLFALAPGSRPSVVPAFQAPERWQQGLLVGQGEPRLIQGAQGGALFDPVGRLLLRSWRGECPAGLEQQASSSADADVRPDWRLIERAWYNAMRRWLRRFAHIGFFDLVLRPALLTVTPTHCDLHFDHRQADIRIRRAGLDIDPGWLPWFGRVVGFHYDRADFTR